MAKRFVIRSDYCPRSAEDMHGRPQGLVPRTIFLSRNARMEQGRVNNAKWTGSARNAKTFVNRETALRWLNVVCPASLYRSDPSGGWFSSEGDACIDTHHSDTIVRTYVTEIDLNG